MAMADSDGTPVVPPSPVENITDHTLGVSGNSLSPNSLNLVFNFVIEIAFLWFNFGLALGVCVSTMKRIEVDYASTGCRDCLREMLTHWLQNGKSITWQNIIDALCSRSVDQRKIAEEIASRYQGLIVPAASQQTNRVALRKMSSPIDAAVHGDTAYFRRYRSRQIFSYNLIKGWLTWADCLVRDASLVVLPVSYKEADQFLLHTIGGIKRKINRTNEDKEEFTDAIYQLTDPACREWICSHYPKLRTKRSQVTVVFSNDHLIVAGGNSAHGPVSTVDVLNVKCQDKIWREVASLPYKVFRASGCVCNGMLYILGGHVSYLNPIRSACVATVSKLVESHSNDQDIFEAVKDLELYDSACVAVHNRTIVAVGGWKLDTETDQQKGTKLVYEYDTDKNDWKELKGQLSESRCYAFAAAFEDKIMIFGGYDRPGGTCTDSVEFAIIPSESELVCQAPLQSEREDGVQGALVSDPQLDRVRERKVAEKYPLKKDDESQSSRCKRPLPGRETSDDQQPAVKKQKYTQSSHQCKISSESDVHGSSPEEYPIANTNLPVEIAKWPSSNSIIVRCQKRGQNLTVGLAPDLICTRDRKTTTQYQHPSTTKSPNQESSQWRKKHYYSDASGEGNKFTIQ